MGDISLRGQGRVKKQGGGPMGTARRDMTHGYYQPDMGMRGGQMFRGGGVVKKKGSIGVALKKGGKAKKQGYKDREDESISARRGKESTKKQSFKDRRDESYGKWGKRKSGKINK